MIKRKSKTFALSSAVLMLMLAGCSAASAPEGAAGSEASPSPEASPSVSASVSPSPSAAPSPSPSPTPEPEKPEQQKYGVFNGAADPHTVEIEADGQPQAYQLGEGVTSKGIEDGMEVFFIYKEKPIDASAKQLILTKLVKAQTFKLKVQNVPTEKPAALEQGKGYELYVFSPLKFEPETGTISFGDQAQGDNLHASITQLPSDYNTDDLKQEARDEFKGMELAEVPKDKRPEPFRDAVVFLEGKQDLDVKQYIVKEYGGNGYIFKVNTFTNEDGGIFSDYIYASLNSLEHVPNPE